MGFIVFGEREGVVCDGTTEEEENCVGEVFDFGELRGGGGGRGGGGERALYGGGGGGKGFEVVERLGEAFESQGSLHFSDLVSSALCVCLRVGCLEIRTGKLVIDRRKVFTFQGERKKKNGQLSNFST